MRAALTVLLMLLAGAAFGAQGPAALLEQARGAYDRGEYAAAAEIYRSLPPQGLESAELYYNLGNAEFKAGHLGRAVAAYRRASKLAPADEDIRFNLEYARGFVQKPADRSGLLERTLGDILMAGSVQVLSATALALFWLLAALGAFLILRRGHKPFLRWTTAAVGFLFVLSAVWASGRMIWERQHRWGVVVAARSEARNGPSPEYQVGFIVPEGREVRVLGREGDWVAIGLPQEGVKGWIRREDLLEEE